MTKKKKLKEQWKATAHKRMAKDKKEEKRNGRKKGRKKEVLSWTGVFAVADTEEEKARATHC